MAPVNDNWANAISISGSSGSVTGSNVGATLETGEPATIYNSESTTVWWKYTPTSVGKLTIDTVGSIETLYGDQMDTVMDIWTGSSLSTLTRVAVNDDIGGGNYGSRCILGAFPGTTYYIRVYSYSDNEVGPIKLNWSFTSSTHLPGSATSFNTKTIANLNSDFYTLVSGGGETVGGLTYFTNLIADPFGGYIYAFAASTNWSGLRLIWINLTPGSNGRYRYGYTFPVESINSFTWITGTNSQGEVMAIDQGGTLYIDDGTFGGNYRLHYLNPFTDSSSSLNTITFTAIPINTLVSPLDFSIRNQELWICGEGQTTIGITYGGVWKADLATHILTEEIYASDWQNYPYTSIAAPPNDPDGAIYLTPTTVIQQDNTHNRNIIRKYIPGSTLIPSSLMDDDAHFVNSLGHWELDDPRYGSPMQLVSNPAPQDGIGHTMHFYTNDISGQGWDLHPQPNTANYPNNLRAGYGHPYWIKPGETITFSMWVRTSADNTTAYSYCSSYIQIWFTDRSAATITNGDYAPQPQGTQVFSDRWTQVQFSYVVPPNCNSFSFRCEGDLGNNGVESGYWHGDWYVSNVSMTNVYLPPWTDIDIGPMKFTADQYNNLYNQYTSGLLYDTDGNLLVGMEYSDPTTYAYQSWIYKFFPKTNTKALLAGSDDLTVTPPVESVKDGPTGSSSLSRINNYRSGSFNYLFASFCQMGNWRGIFFIDGYSNTFQNYEIGMCWLRQMDGGVTGWYLGTI